MKILFADTNHPVLHELLTKAGHQCDLFWDRPAAELISLLPGYDALVLRSRFKITSEIIDQAKQLKCIGRVGAGMENIDVPYAEGKGIRCVCAPEGNRDAVGEHAIGMLLMLLNHLKKADLEVRNGVWLRAENRGTEIKDKTVGIIGYGHMGSAFAEKISGFGCRILAHDKYRNIRGSSHTAAAGLDEIFDKCDILSIHLPLTEETTNYVNAAFLKKFRKPIYLINTARGKCLNTADLVAALKRGKVLGACLDVLEYESTSFENLAGDGIPAPMKYLLSSPQVVLSPHIAGWTHESNYKMSKLIAERMTEVLR
jgi:D-3-phosphoglycerate dehydrogenase